jgi:hypothetical protein
MSTPRHHASATRVEPPTLDELRLKLAQYVVDAQHAELQQQSRQLADAATARESKAA